MEPTRQISAMQTILRNRQSGRGDFVFYSDRIVSLLIEEALGHLPYREKIVTTPVDKPYHGVEFDCKLCAVSVLRAGSAMESPLRAICQGIRVGKMLIQSDENKNPRLFYLKVPKDIAGRHVLVLDPTLASGASSQMAIRVLLDHGVPEENIFFVTVISTLRGLHLLSYSFPKVTIITSAVDPGLNAQGHIIPGMGNYSDRYFGTDSPTDTILIGDELAPN